MTCIACGRSFSWAHLERIGTHIHLVLEADLLGQNPPCGVALGADIENYTPTFLCLAHAVEVGAAASTARNGRASR